MSILLFTPFLMMTTMVYKTSDENFVGPNGNTIFVNRDELTKGNTYYSDKVGMMYESAFSTPKSLVLNISCTSSRP